MVDWKTVRGQFIILLLRTVKRHISDFRKTTWEMLLNKTKAGKVTHASDGISYMIHWKYPLRGKLKVIQR